MFVGELIQQVKVWDKMCANVSHGQRGLISISVSIGISVDLASDRRATLAGKLVWVCCSESVALVLLLYQNKVSN